MSTIGSNPAKAGGRKELSLRRLMKTLSHDRMGDSAWHHYNQLLIRETCFYSGFQIVGEDGLIDVYVTKPIETIRLKL